MDSACLDFNTAGSQRTVEEYARLFEEFGEEWCRDEGGEELEQEATPLEPERKHIELYFSAMFRHAGTQGWVSVRAFYHDNTPFQKRLWPCALSGGLKAVIDHACDIALRAALDPNPVVVCPPLAIFDNRDRAREQDLIAGLALSVELDQWPRKALEFLIELLGPCTCVVRSGGTWTDPQTGEVEDKLHAHWRWAPHVASKEALARQKEARRLAAAIVGGDPTNVPAVHPIRLPGSIHRKSEPRLCTIEVLDAEAEIDLDEALSKLKAKAVELKVEAKGNGATNSYEDYASQQSNGAGQLAYIANIIAGKDLHVSIVGLAAYFVCSGMGGGAATNAIRALMEHSAAQHETPGRWQNRYNDIPRAVSSAEAKFAADRAQAVNPPPDQTSGAVPEERYPLYLHGEPNPGTVIDWRVHQLVRKVGVGLLSGQWGLYKTFIAVDFAVACMIPRPFAGREIAERCGVLFIAAEGSEEVPLRLEAASDGKDKLPFVWADDCPSLMENYAFSDLLKIAKSANDVLMSQRNTPLGLIIIDTMAASAGFTDEGSAAEAQRVMNVLHRVAKATSVFVMVVDHFGKNVEQGTRGSSAKESFVSTVLAVLGERDQAGNTANVRMTARKVRGAKAGMEFPFTTRLVTVPPTVDWLAGDTLVIDWEADKDPLDLNSAGPQKVKRKVWPGHLILFRNALNKALAAPSSFEHQPFKDGGTYLVVDSAVVRWEFNRVYNAEGDTEEQRAATRTRQYNRHLQKAQELELIGVAADATLPSQGYRKVTLLWRTDGE
jgi:hypothetical protein